MFEYSRFQGNEIYAEEKQLMVSLIQKLFF